VIRTDLRDIVILTCFERGGTRTMVLSMQGGGAQNSLDWDLSSLAYGGHVSITYYSAFCLPKKIAPVFLWTLISKPNTQK
jgi:hypothetical protein